MSKRNGLLNQEKPKKRGVAVSLVDMVRNAHD
jgi:hypothetical protein